MKVDTAPVMGPKSDGYVHHGFAPKSSFFYTDYKIAIGTWAVIPGARLQRTSTH